MYAQLTEDGELMTHSLGQTKSLARLHDELLPSDLLHFCVVLWDLVMYFRWKVLDVLGLVYKGT